MAQPDRSPSRTGDFLRHVLANATDKGRYLNPIHVEDVPRIPSHIVPNEDAQTVLPLHVQNAPLVFHPSALPGDTGDNVTPITPFVQFGEGEWGFQTVQESNRGRLLTLPKRNIGYGPSFQDAADTITPEIAERMAIALGVDREMASESAAMGFLPILFERADKFNRSMLASMEELIRSLSHDPYLGEATSQVQFPDYDFSVFSEPTQYGQRISVNASMHGGGVNVGVSRNPAFLTQKWFSVTITRQPRGGLFSKSEPVSITFHCPSSQLLQTINEARASGDLVTTRELNS